MFDNGDQQADVLCPECQVNMRLTRAKSTKLDLSDVKEEKESGKPLSTLAKNKYLNQIWLGALVKNFALIQLVEA